jgi:hypothetical protein
LSWRKDTCKFGGSIQIPHVLYLNLHVTCNWYNFFCYLPQNSM